ncbi:MAG: hypothetical protein ACTTKI_00455 [Tannerella sp.]|uniref:hypothetical protein n=1 Tax=Tannerella sp. TaxID=2382127 RepID=UPI003FA30461
MRTLDRIGSKSGSFRKVKFTVYRLVGYGRYQLEAKYRGKNISIFVNDASLWDDIDDEENKEERRYALKTAYGRIVNEYKRMYIDF